MSDVHLSEAPADVGPPPTEIKISGEGSISARDAGRALAKARYDKPKEQPVAAAVKDAPVEESTAQADDADSPQETTGETQEPAPVDVPAIEPPRSWTKEAKAHWAKLDPEAQQSLLEQDSQANAAVKTRLNEAAEKLKGLTAKEQAVEQARQQYESALPVLLQNLQATMNGEFADLKTMADVQKMAAEDWPRYIRWDAAQKQMAAVDQEVRAANHRQFTEKQTKFADYAKEQDIKLVEHVPEMADQTKAAELQKKAVAALKAIGFDEKELGEAWNGQKPLELRDHRVQLLIRDAALWRDAQAKATQVTKKPVPQVQRPGTAQPQGAAQAAQIETLGKQIDNTKGLAQIRAAAKLITARRAR